MALIVDRAEEQWEKQFIILTPHNMADLLNITSEQHHEHDDTPYQEGHCVLDHTHVQEMVKDPNNA